MTTCAARKKSGGRCSVGSVGKGKRCIFHRGSKKSRARRTKQRRRSR